MLLHRERELERLLEREDESKQKAWKCKSEEEIV
jgi:hypothetical protein